MTFHAGSREHAVNKMNVRQSFRKIYGFLKPCHHHHQALLRNLAIWSSSKPNEWSRAVSDAEKIVGYPTSFMSLRCFLSDEMANVAIQIRKLIGTRHPLLKTARGFLDNGKHNTQTRGLIVLLISKAAGAASSSKHDLPEMVSGIYPSQRTLAEITEMIHTASLIHKGVVNLDSIQPGDGNHGDMEFGNKMAVLSGDFLLANASTSLADLNNTNVVEEISSAIGDLMQADFTPLRDHNGQPVLPDSVTFEDWERQTFLQSGSLLAKSCYSALELAGHREDAKLAAFNFGKNMAFARQMHEDLVPFVSEGVDADRAILSSAPVIKHTEKGGLLEIKSSDHNLNRVTETLRNGSAVQWCIAQGKSYSDKALQALDILPSSDAKRALTNIVNATTILPGR